MAKKPNVTDIKDALLEQLENKGAIESQYIDLVYDYMELHSTKRKLIKDIKERGVAVRYDNGGGQFGYKKNDSVDQLLKVNQQMIKILDYLGLKPPKDVVENDDYNEM
ncbi:MAG TPA: P27 family phage terminase small subunit [Clostridia bacterium]|jgi:hypothetical protein|nr:P27 family phage terminase small subunit [Clostridia bacterium]